MDSMTGGSRGQVMKIHTVIGLKLMESANVC